MQPSGCVMLWTTPVCPFEDLFFHLWCVKEASPLAVCDTLLLCITAYLIGKRSVRFGRLRQWSVLILRFLVWLLRRRRL